MGFACVVLRVSTFVLQVLFWVNMAICFLCCKIFGAKFNIVSAFFSSTVHSLANNRFSRRFVRMENMVSWQMLIKRIFDKINGVLCEKRGYLVQNAWLNAAKCSANSYKTQC